MAAAGQAIGLGPVCDRYYGSHHILAVRVYNTIMVNLQFPMSELLQSLDRFQIHVIPIPVPGGQNHATILQDTPQYITNSALSEYFIEFQSKPDIKTSNLEDTHDLMKSSSNFSCLISILQVAVQQLCHFTVITDYIKPSLYIIDKSHVVIANMTNLTVICPSSAPKNVRCSKFCRLTIPCRCSLSSASEYIPARVAECIRGEVTLLHGVNLALLQNFFSEFQLSNIWGISLLPDPMEIFLPDLKVFEADYSHEMAEVKRTRFTLDRISNLN